MMVDYELKAAKARQAKLREQSGYIAPERGPTFAQLCARRERERQREVREYRKANEEKWLWRIAQKIMGVVSECVPDGDPIEMLAPYVQRLTGCDEWDTTKWLDKAARKHLDVSSYNRYLINAWDGWNEVCEPDQKMDNPWRPVRR